MRQQTVFLKIGCKAPLSVFAEDYDDIPKRYQDIIEASNGVPCEGRGEIGPYCVFPKQCPFADWDEDWDVE